MTRIGASQAFFNIVAQFNAEKLIKDTRSLNTVMKAVSLDTFEAILKPIDDMIMQMDNAINAVMDLGVAVGDATVEFEKFYGESANIEAMKDELMEIGASYAMVGTEALAAGSRAAQVGNLIGRQNINILVEQAAILAEISDLTLEEAQRGMIQLNQQAGILYGDMTRQQLLSLSAREQEIVLTENSARALDVLNTVANRSVALEGDLVKTMTNFASGAKLAGDSFEFMAAASATLLEAGEEQGTAGRALRMMYARLGGDINGARSKIEALGFQFTDQNGQMKSMQGILEDLHTKGWSQLNPAMKQNIAQTIAGNRHYVRFIKLMENYERVTQLAADANLRLDSASEQANKALESQVRQLQEVEARLENAKAAVGEGLMPFTIAMKEAQLNYLQSVEMLTDGLGDFGKTAGRFIGVFKVTEGFLKFGIALQSIGVGLEMFSSVQRSLQGVEIAVSNLHSKQAAYKDFNQKMTQDEMYLVQGMLQHQQVMNRANKEIQLAKTLTKDADQQLLENERERLRITELLSQKNMRIYELNREMGALRKMETAQMVAGDSTYGRRAARIEYENKMGRQLLDTQKEIYSQKLGAEDAYMRQMLADFEVFGAFDAGELKSLDQKNEKLRERHTLLQTIKAENEANRALRDFDASGVQSRNRRKDAFQMSEVERQILADTIQGEKTKTALLIAGLPKAKERNEQQKEYGGFLKAQMGQLRALGEAIDGDTENLHLSKQAYDGLMYAIKAVNGEYMQTERALRVVDAANKDAFVMENRLKNVTSARNAVMKYKKQNQGELLRLDNLDANLKKQIAPLLDVINNAEAERAHQAEKMIELTEILTRAEEKGLDALKAKRAEMYKGSEEFKKDEERMKNARRSMFISMSNLAGLSAGLFKNSTVAAAASAAMMGSQLVYVGASSAKAGIELVKVQYKMYATQFAAQGASKGVAGLKASFMAMSAALAPILAIGGAFYLFAKHSEKMSKNVGEFNDMMLETEALFNRLSPQTKLFSDDALAQTLGIANYNLSELKDNTQLTEEVMGKLKNHGMDFSDSLQNSVDDSINLLSLITAIRKESGLINEQMFYEKKATMLDQEGGIGRLLQRFTADEEAMAEFYKSIYIDPLDTALGDPFKSKTMKAGGFIIDLMDIMEDGFKLSEEQLDLVGEALGEQIEMQIRSMNSLVMTHDMAAYYNNNLNDAIGNTTDGVRAQATEIENLTREVYNFGNAREELFFGGKYGNVTGSLYKQVVTQGVGTLYHKNEVIMSNNFHGFFNEREAAAKIIAVLDEYIATGATA